MTSSNPFDVLLYEKGKENVKESYNAMADTYDDVVSSLEAEAQCSNAAAAFEPSQVVVLDVASGTGLVGQRTAIARRKGIYRDLYCEFFTRNPLLDIPNDSYDMIVSCGAFLQGHLPYDCFHEMIRLVKSGRVICIVTRSSSFDNKTVPEYRDRLLPLLQQLENESKWKKLKWEIIPKYNKCNEGTLIVYQVL